MIELFIENEQQTEEISEEIRKTIEDVCEETLLYEECNFDAEVSVTFVDNEEIRRLNNEFRNKDSATDVLSFPILEYDENGDIVDADFDFDEDKVMLGDIVISAERAMEQAKEYGHSFKREIAFLCVHSMLHLLGYDHVDSAEDEEIMIQKQKDILERLNITRD